MNQRHEYLIIVISIFIILSVGCQDLFTNSLLSQLSPDPGDLSGDELISFGLSARESGDEEKMDAALTAIQEELVSDPDNEDLLYEGGQLALALSGLTELLYGEIGGMDVTELEQQFNDSVDYLMTAGNLLEEAESNGAELGQMDYILGGLGLLMEASGVTDIDSLAAEFNDPGSAMDPVAASAAVDFIMLGADQLDDYSTAMLSAILGGITL